MTKLIQQLNFSSSNYYDVTGFVVEPDSPANKHYYGDGASLSAAGSKRSALSASDAECFSLCLGAGPLCIVVTLVPAAGGPDVPVLGSAPPGGVTGGAASPATPAHTHDDNHDLLSALLWSSASSLSGSAESLAIDHPAVLVQRREEVTANILELKDRKPVKVEIKIYLTEHTVTRWETVVKDKSIYLRVPSVLSAGSKDSFVMLLDYAEERLGLHNCIICVSKNRSDRATLLRTFMFMGFQILPPNSPLMAGIEHPDYLFLNYNMQ